MEKSCTFLYNKNQKVSESAFYTKMGESHKDSPMAGV